MRRAVGTILAAAGLFFSSPAWAWDGEVTGVIDRIDVVADGENYGFRVYLSGAPAMCAGTTTPWAYLNTSTTNYDAMVAMINSAFLTERAVIIYTTKTGAICNIGYIVVRK